MISRFTVRFVSDILAAKRLPAYDNLRITNERPPTPFLILLRVQVHDVESVMTMVEFEREISFLKHKEIFLFIYNIHEFRSDTSISLVCRAGRLHAIGPVTLSEYIGWNHRPKHHCQTFNSFT